MKQFDIYLNVPALKDGDEQREMAAFVAKLQEILQQITDNLGVIEVVDSAPASTQLNIKGDGKGGILTDIRILNHATQSSRRLYYKDSAGNLRYLESD